MAITLELGKHYCMCLLEIIRVCRYLDKHEVISSLMCSGLLSNTNLVRGDEAITNPYSLDQYGRF
jgi:hypothetical protein